MGTGGEREMERDKEIEMGGRRERGRKEGEREKGEGERRGRGGS